MAEAFFENYFIVNNSKEHLPAVITYVDGLPKFKTHLSNKVHEKLMRILTSYDDKKKRKLSKTASLASELYSFESSTPTQVFDVFYAILHANMSLARRIEVYGTLLAKRGALNYLYEAEVDKRFQSAICIEMMDIVTSKKCDSNLTDEELKQLASALEAMGFLPDNGIEDKRLLEFRFLMAEYLVKGANVDVTAGVFATYDFKYPEQIRNCLNYMMVRALMPYGDSEKLIALQVQLRNKIYKSRPRVFDNAFRSLLSRVKHEYAGVVDLEKANVFFRYLGDLYKHNVIDCTLIVEILNEFLLKPFDEGFAMLFSRVYDKLCTEIGDAEMECYNAQISVMILDGKIPADSPFCKHWIEKNELKLRSAGRSNSRVQVNYGKLLEDYCKGTHSLSWILKDFEGLKNASLQTLTTTFLNRSFDLAINGDEYHKKMAVLLKNLKNSTFKHRASELNNFIFELMRYHMKNFFDVTPEPYNREKKLGFVEFLNQLFVKDVIDEELVVECLDKFLNDWGEINDVYHRNVHKS